MVLNMDCEPRTHPTEMVTIERVKNELQQELHLPEKITESLLKISNYHNYCNLI